MDRKPAARSPPQKVEEEDVGGLNRKMPPTNSGDGDDEVDETLLMAGAGARIENMEDYEGAVIRHAELSSTPRLMMPNHAATVASSESTSATTDANVLVGFPPLHSMTPSRNVHADLSHVQSVLQHLRRQIRTKISSSTTKNSSNITPVDDRDFLKEQMLLALLHQVTGDTSLGVRSKQEAAQEVYRQKMYRNQQQNPKESPPSLLTGQGTTATHAIGKNGNKDGGAGRTGETTDSAEGSEDPSSRLEDIKRGKKVVRFAPIGVTAAQVLSPTAVLLRSKQRRKSMQERRGLTGSTNDDETNNNIGTKKRSLEQLTPNELEQLQKRKDQLRKIRMEREKRRQKQRSQKLPKRRSLSRKKRRLSSNRSQQQQRGRNRDDDEEQEEEEEEEFEFAGDEHNESDSTNKGRSKSSKVGDENTTNIDNFDETEICSDKRNGNITCPLCQESILLPSTNDGESSHSMEHADALLAQHMNLCQQQQMGRRSRRRPVVSTVAPVPRQPKYTELDEDEEDHNDFDVDSDDSDEVETGLWDDEVDDELDVDDTRKRSFSRRYAPEKVDDWDEMDYEDRVDDWIDHGLENMKKMKEHDNDETPPGEQVYEGGLVIPAWVNNRLFSYQRTGLKWMWELHRQQTGGILGDEMGLGKTIQVCAFLGAMAASRKLKSILIISPATMLQHWLQELAKWAPGIRRLLVHQSGDSQSSTFLSQGRSNITNQKLVEIDNWLKKARQNRLFEIIDEEDLETRDPASFCGTAFAFVTTFENVRRNEEVWTRHKWSYVVMDEAQKIRNPTADITLVCKRLKTPHRLALSGTPIQNELRELWSIFDFVFPSRLGTLPVFEVEFADPIKRGGYANASPLQVQLAYRCALLVKDLINPYLLRRLKKDINEVKRMPGKKEHVLFCRLSDQQRNMYEAFLRSDYVRNVFRGSAQLLGAITMLQKICNHPDLVCPPDKSSVERFLQNGYFNENELMRDLNPDSYDSDGDLLDFYDDESVGMSSFVKRSGKLDVLAKILPLWKKQGHRVLIFCQWIKMLDLIMRFVESQGWKYGRLDGKTNVASRQSLVNRFNQDDSYFIMLCTTKTGGVGLNLTGANRIILYDPNWNPSVDAQARERSWRFGQEREVTVYRLVVAGSVEEKIYQRQIFKQAISNSVLTDQRQRRLFSQKDLKDLFTLKEDSGSLAEGAGGIVETAQVTRGLGYINPDDEEHSLSETQKDDGEIMKTVLQSQGLAGVFDHDVVESNGASKKASARELEDKAKSIAREALRNLSQSVVPGNTFNPESRFCGISSGSSGILSTISDRNHLTSTSAMSSSNDRGEVQQYTSLLKNLREFVRLNAPTTDEILANFSSQVSSMDAAIFRRLLKSIAVLQHGRWRLKLS